MDFLQIILMIVLVGAVIASVTAFICFYMIFYSKKRAPRTEWVDIPEGAIYEERREQLTKWALEVHDLPHTEVSLTTFDGLTLRGKYYEFEKGAPIEIILHGYKGNYVRDLSGGIIRCKMLGHNVLVYDHRASGDSDGSVITFGINESLDCLKWVDYVIENIDKDARIILAGVSMGAATVMIASGMDLPKNVIGAVADCGYTSARDIIKKVIRDMKLPADLLYPFASLGARLYGGFDLDKTSPIEAMEKCRIPIIFFHGDTDDFVPHEMSLKNFEKCVSPKKRMVTIPNAGHGLCLPVDVELYLKELREFFGEQDL